MLELQQSQLYQKYIKALGWNADFVDGSVIYYKKIPFVGVFAKLQRPTTLPRINNLISFCQTNRIKKIAIEPDYMVAEATLRKYLSEIKKSKISIYKSYFLHTKTILIDLTRDTKQIFSSFTSAKRRAVRKAEKNNIWVKPGNIDKLIQIKNQSAGLLGFITTTGINKMWQVFGRQQAIPMLTYHKDKPNQILAGLLLILYQKKAYYWIAGSSRKGKQLFAPTLLVWEALKLAKDKGIETFDFVGIWDERLPHQNQSWKGFSKFKDGFGGKYLYYPLQK